MNRKMLAGLAAATALVSFDASAQVSGGMTSNTPTQFLSLNGPGLSDGAITVATRTGGTLYTSDQPFADFPAGGVFEDTFIAAGPTSGSPSLFTFVAPQKFLNFLWGSPDTYNSLVINTTAGDVTFDPVSLGFPTTNGDQTVSQYVAFTAQGAARITGFSLVSDDTDAFEAANFGISGVPEPTTWGMMIMGFGAIGASMRYRRRSTKVAFA